MEVFRMKTEIIRAQAEKAFRDAVQSHNLSGDLVRKKSQDLGD